MQWISRHIADKRTEWKLQFCFNRYLKHSLLGLGIASNSLHLIILLPLLPPCSSGREQLLVDKCWWLLSVGTSARYVGLLFIISFESEQFSWGQQLCSVFPFALFSRPLISSESEPSRFVQYVWSLLGFSSFSCFLDEFDSSSTALTLLAMPREMLGSRRFLWFFSFSASNVSETALLLSELERKLLVVLFILLNSFTSKTVEAE